MTCQCSRHDSRHTAGAWNGSRFSRQASCPAPCDCMLLLLLLLQNHAEALRWFRKAADKNSGLGLYGLGYMYMSGTAVAQDYDTAFKKLQAAADAGDRDAHFYLGSMYYNVRGTVAVGVGCLMLWSESI